mmetsp:Transcript_14004/g.35761  ORF Transcript_14004/g.35761 Transcript_14004/m.35761 type:complete len:201 (+) Transcript_14004:1129-1731(+)
MLAVPLLFLLFFTARSCSRLCAAYRCVGSTLAHLVQTGGSSDQCCNALCNLTTALFVDFLTPIGVSTKVKLCHSNIGFVCLSHLIGLIGRFDVSGQLHQLVDGTLHITSSLGKGHRIHHLLIENAVQILDCIGGLTRQSQQTGEQLGLVLQAVQPLGVSLLDEEVLLGRRSGVLQRHCDPLPDRFHLLDLFDGGSTGRLE